MPDKNNANCPYCASKNIKKHGAQKKKLQTLQRYFCKNCKKTFTLKEQGKNKTYPINIILNAVSSYNLGYPQSEIINSISKKFKTKPSQKTISNWINEFKNILPYSKIREQCKKLESPETIIETHEFLHNNLNYKFQLHKAKLYHLFHNIKYNNQFTNLSKFYEPLKAYLQKIPTKKFPHHIFKPGSNLKIKSDRASQLKFKHLKINHIKKQNLANKLTSLALNLAKTNKDRHNAVQNFFLINDSTTIAAEIPIYLIKDDLVYFLSRRFSINPNKYKTPITGHIDILQIRNSLIHIMDYKPDAKNQNPVEQLTIYALALASRTKLAIKDFKCAWFDQNNYFEFFPLHAVYSKKII